MDGERSLYASSNLARVIPSFTDEVKSELAGLQPAKPCCQHAELLAIVHTLAGPREATSLSVRISRNALARKVVQLVKVTGGSLDGLTIGPGERRPNYRTRLRLRPALPSRGICCARAFLRGAFLARGALGEPGGGYHLELSLFPAQEGAMAEVLQRLRVPVHRMSRRGRIVFYFKAADEISRVLGLIGANRAVIRLENHRILREMRSQANRRVNSETANLDKRLRVALGQVEWIRRLRATEHIWGTLSEALQDAARLRLEHPQARLETLAQHGRMTKSAMAHRLRRLRERAVRNGLID